MGSTLSHNRVDDIPFLLRPLLLIFGYGMGILLFLYIILSRLTIKVNVTGKENLDLHPNHIYCLWHCYDPVAFQCSAPSISNFLDRNSFAMMQHPAIYMKPIHVLLRMMRINKLVMGSTGNDGRKAADQLVKLLREGYSTIINPDGPYGPPFELKKGVLHLSLQSNVPIVPLKFKSSKFLEMNSWDRKKFALPFRKVEVVIGKPIQISESNFEKIQEDLILRLS